MAIAPSWPALHLSCRSTSPEAYILASASTCIYVDRLSHEIKAGSKPKLSFPLVQQLTCASRASTPCCCLRHPDISRHGHHPALQRYSLPDFVSPLSSCVAGPYLIVITRHVPIARIQNHDILEVIGCSFSMRQLVISLHLCFSLLSLIFSGVAFYISTYFGFYMSHVHDIVFASRPLRSSFFRLRQA